MRLGLRLTTTRLFVLNACNGSGSSSSDSLASVAAWKKASPARRKDIATRLAKAFGKDLALASLKTVRGLPIATFRHRPTKVEFILVPGGKFAMGLSPGEEAVIRAEAGKRKGTDNWDEEFGHLLKSVGRMRPVRSVEVAPFLTARKAGVDVAYARVIDVLAGAPFRLLSEAEWEYAARGGVAGELTPQGNAVPTRPKAFVNRFGIADLGHTPELCADAYAPSYKGAPKDATPRRGTGPRVARGGASMLWPWQACGEWQLLCNATRGSSDAWDNGVSLRLSLGIVVKGRTRAPAAKAKR